MYLNESDMKSHIGKKERHEWRFCVHFHVLNNVTCLDAYPILRIGESLDALCEGKYFCTLDILAATADAF